MSDDFDDYVKVLGEFKNARSVGEKLGMMAIEIAILREEKRKLTARVEYLEDEVQEYVDAQPPI
jgi:hypothetical protein